MTHQPNKTALLRGSSLARHVSVPRADANDPAALFRQLNAAIDEFKKTNDERIKDLEDGKLDALVTEKTEKINAAITQVQADLDRIAKESARARLASATPDIDVEAQAMAFRAARASQGLRTPPADEPVSADEIEQVRAYARAVNSAIRRNGESLSPDVRAALSVGQDSEGGFLVPPTILTEMQSRLFETSDVRAVARVITISGSELKLPLDVQEAASGGWVTERQARTETGTPGLAEQTISVHEQFAEPRVTQTLLDDAAVNVDGWLAGKIVDIFGRTENAAFVTGNGVGKPKGILGYAADAATTVDKDRPWGKLQYVAAGNDGAFAPVSTGVLPGDALINLIHALKAAYRANARFAMNRLTVAEVRKLKDGDGNYLWGPSLQLGQPATLLGYPIAEWEDMPDIASGSFAIAFGDFRGYTIVDRAGIRVLRDPYTAKPWVKFYTTKRVGGAITDFDAIKLLKFSNS